MKKVNYLLLLTIIFGLYAQKIQADAGDVLGPTIAGAALGGAFGGGRGAAIGAGVGFGIGALNSSQRDRRRAYSEPAYRQDYYDQYDDQDYYYERPIRTRRAYRTRPYAKQQIIKRPGTEVIYVD